MAEYMRTEKHQFDTLDAKFTVYSRMSRELIQRLREDGYEVTEIKDGKTGNQGDEGADPSIQPGKG